VTAPHFFVDPRDVERIEVGDRLPLAEADSQHALRALRLRDGEVVTVANNLGWVGQGRVRIETGDRASIEVLEVTKHDLVTYPIVKVTMAPPKGDRLAWAIQKLGEIGVDEVMLVETKRTVRFPSLAAHARLKTVAREAAMQARRPLIMAVHAGEPLELMFAEDARTTLDLVLTETAERLLSEVLREAVGAINVFVGPEGGFTDDELELAAKRGAVAASLGPGILRTETAAVVGASLVLHRYGRLG
jgi:16S rRNA (uracil1498-N3)-methyltransferase